MIIVTGGLGFIGSVLVHELNKTGIDEILIVDRFKSEDKWLNVRDLKYVSMITPEDFVSSEIPYDQVSTIFHLGACSTTTETDMDFLWDNNVEFSKFLFHKAVEHNCKFIYASSAATYGSGDQGFEDDHKKMKNLQPLNKYAYSKCLFDNWVLDREMHPKLWVGLKFFNVFGPHEYHKGSQKSVVNQAFDQIQKNGQLKLFKSDHEDYSDGEQIRDFVYVKDVCKAMLKFNNQSVAASGIYNMGTGEPRTFNDLGKAVFKAMNKNENIEYIELPENLKGKYQYYTKANMEKFLKVFPDFKFMTLENSIEDYIQNYLNKDNPYLSSK